MRSVISDSVNRDLAKISEWCKLWGMKMNHNKTQSMIVSRSRTLQSQHPDHFTDNVALTTSDSFKFLGVTFDSKISFDSHVSSVSSVIAQKWFVDKGFEDFWYCVSLDEVFLLFSLVLF